MDTTTRDCKLCGREFDSIYQVDHGICDECREYIEKFYVDKDKYSRTKRLLENQIDKLNGVTNNN